MIPEILLDQAEDVPSRDHSDPRITKEFPTPQSVADQLEVIFMAPLDASNSMMYDLDMLQSEGNLFTVNHVADHETTTSSVTSATPVHILGQVSAPTFAEVFMYKVALFFQVYFEAIHPRYPFLDMEECSRGYQDWKTGSIFMSGGDAWRLYLVLFPRECSI